MTLHQTKIYQSSDGDWIYFDGTNKNYFDFESEAKNMADKIEFVKRVQAVNTTIAKLFLDTKDLDSVYFSEGFDSAGSDPITDVDIASLGITAAEVSAGITLFKQIQNLRNNASVVSGDYQSTVNALRSDLGETQ